MTAIVKPALAAPGVVTAVTARWFGFERPERGYAAAVFIVEGGRARMVRHSSIAAPDTSKAKEDQRLLLSTPMAAEAGQHLGIINLSGGKTYIAFFLGGPGCFHSSPHTSEGGYPEGWLGGEGFKTGTVSYTLCLRWELGGSAAAAPLAALPPQVRCPPLPPHRPRRQPTATHCTCTGRTSCACACVARGARWPAAQLLRSK